MYKVNVITKSLKVEKGSKEKKSQQQSNAFEERLVLKLEGGHKPRNVDSL